MANGVGMYTGEFIAKWRQVSLTERAASQQHFLDLCEVLGHGKPAAEDPTGESFTFERGSSKQGGGEGWADVWKRGYFGWEYKGKKKDLEAAYGQLLKYRESLENPPLLVVCDMDRIVVHTNFTNTAHRVHEIPLEALGEPQHLEILRAVFFNPEKLHPIATAQAVTEEAARRVGSIAVSMRKRELEPHTVARFLDRVVFCLFAEDVGLLPEKIFTRTVQNSRKKPERFARQVGQLFQAMAHGGDFGPEEIRHFNGSLFSDAPVLTLTLEEMEYVRLAAELDWSGVDPSIFGTLFERGLDPDKRSQLGAHYTSRADIETLVEPVVMQPLRREWDAVRADAAASLEAAETLPKGKKGQPPTPGDIRAHRERHRSEARSKLYSFLERLAEVKVLDPACGSGNFLYVTLQKLKDLEKEVITHAQSHALTGFLPQVHPSQLYGIEINSYAYDLAQMTVWIGYLQWHHQNGYPVSEKPILRTLEGNFRNMDAILDLSDPEHPREPEWPAVDFIVGNPPFKGDKFMKRELGGGYVKLLRATYSGRVPGGADLCCYWFEQGRSALTTGNATRVGLIATQGIRGGANRSVLTRIKETGDIFFAISDRDWINDGASVHVSLVGFDLGIEQSKLLDGQVANEIYPNLQSGIDVTQAKALLGNADIAFLGSCKGGPFDITEKEALSLLHHGGNPNGRPNSDVVRPVVNTNTLANTRASIWIIDNGDAELDAACLYEAPHKIVESLVKPKREQNDDDWLRRNWWRPQRMRPRMRELIAPLERFIVTTTTSKHRIITWLQHPVLPDHQLVVFARDDYYFFGALLSRVYETWTLAQGTQLRERTSGFRYTPQSCFDNFPFPHPTPEQEDAIAAAARELDTLRTNWLNPPEWTREEVLEFPGSVDGPWSRYVHDADSRGIGTVRYPRVVPKNAACAGFLKPRTLTNLYNERPTWLRNAHRKLDEAVFAAYGWPADLPDEELLRRLLELNHARAAAQG